MVSADAGEAARPLPGGLNSLRRHRQILAALRQAGSVEMIDLAERLETSAETIRKDLIFLEHRGHLQRVRGGAVPVQGMTFEPAIAARTENVEAKRRIAARAVAGLPSGAAIVLDAGSTTQLMAELIPDDLPLKVFTNSLPAAQTLLSKPLVECFTIGGRVRPTSSAEVGPTALRTLAALHIDAAYVGTNALSFTRGLSTPDPEEAAVKAAMIDCAVRTVLLADHAKLGKNALCAYAGLDAIDLLITDSGVSQEHREELATQLGEVEFA